VSLAARTRPPPEEARHVTARIHLAFTGPRGGDVALYLDGGRIHVARGQVPRPPTSTIRLAAPTMLALLAGSTDVTTAQLVGHIAVEGEPAAGMILGALVSTFRAQPAARRLARLLVPEARA
jgi:putative sterol carrier protein